MTDKIVYVVDDDAAMRDSIEALLASAGFEVRTFPSAQEILADKDLARAGCLIADIRMPGMDGLALQEELNRRGIHLPIVFVTGHGDVPLAVRAMRAGAGDFFEKPFDGDSLIASIQKMLSTPRARGPGRGDDEAASRIAALTAREREVLERLVLGEPNKVIAHKLGISPRTVEIHRAHVMEKTRCSSLSELVRLALTAGIDP